MLNKSEKAEERFSLVSKHIENMKKTQIKLLEMKPIKLEIKMH